MSYFDKTLDEKVAQADDYYAVDNHISHFDWDKWSNDEHKAAVAQSEREINLYLGIDLLEVYGDEDFPIADWENFRPDFAIFEQAFFILDNTARTRTSASGPEAIESEQYQKEERTSGVGVSPQATRFLQLNRIQLERG